MPLVLRGSPFELSVWEALRTIPFGETRSYRDVARLIDNPRAVRAVGAPTGAIGSPWWCRAIAWSTPNGKLGGYGGGLWRKIRLLEIEGVRR